MAASQLIAGGKVLFWPWSKVDHRSPRLTAGGVLTGGQASPGNSAASFVGVPWALFKNGGSHEEYTKCLGIITGMGWVGLG